MSDLSGVAVVIPVYNEAASLPLVLRDLPEVGRVVVVDNGSTDGSAEAAVEAGTAVVREERRGYGSACLAGLAHLRQLPDPPIAVAFLDGDYSDHPDVLPELAAPVLSGECDLMLGSRMLGEREPGAMPPQAVFGNRLACGLMRLLFDADYTDLGPFRVIGWSALESLGMQDTNFGWTIEMQIKAAKAGLRCREAPVPYRKRIGISKISGTVSGSVRAGCKILWTIARYAAWKPAVPQRGAPS
ncbi:MAG: glycosyltransferase family 2 protein [Planctomycetota bacterium]